MGVEQLEQKLDYVCGRMEIANVLSAYAHGVDRKNKGLILSCFHDDATFAFCGAPPVPVPLFYDSFDEQSAILLVTHHSLSNLMIRMDGDSAHTQVYLTAYHLVAADAPSENPLFPGKGKEYAIMIGARYVDDFQKRDNGWRIQKRELTFDWSYNVDGPQIPKEMLVQRDGGFSAAPSIS